MEREAIARERRRRQALEQLEFEREREAALRDQLEEVITEQLGSEIDDAAFASMPPADVEVVREAFGTQDAGDEFEDEIAWGDTSDGDDGGNAEVARLEAELAECRRRQEAFERYVEALR